MDTIRYNRGASGLGGSLAGEDPAILESGFSVMSKDEEGGMFGFKPGDDNSGSTFEGDLYERRHTGATGRPLGTER
jgi:hypothetical protein